jgi:hypothetical protein
MSYEEHIAFDKLGGKKRGWIGEWPNLTTKTTEGRLGLQGSRAGARDGRVRREGLGFGVLVQDEEEIAGFPVEILQDHDSSCMYAAGRKGHEKGFGLAMQH